MYFLCLASFTQSNMFDIYPHRCFLLLDGIELYEHTTV